MPCPQASGGVHPRRPAVLRRQRLITSGGLPVQSDTGSDLVVPAGSLAATIDAAGQLVQGSVNSLFKGLRVAAAQ